jgi:DNA-binding MarR family transcriptional regulator
MSEDRDIKIEIIEPLKNILNIPEGQRIMNLIFKSPSHLKILIFILKPENLNGVLIENISKETNIPESTTRRILKRFYKNGLVEYQIPEGGERRDGPKPRLWRLKR